MVSLVDQIRAGVWSRPPGLAPEHESIINLIAPGSSVLDLGCGSGELLRALMDFKGVKGAGVEISEVCIQAAVARGVPNVHHGDLDEGLADYADQSFDYVILTNTIQVLHRPLDLILEMARVGRRCVVGFPNFANWRARCQLALCGRMPKTRRLPYEWYDTPNIHLTTIRDFEAFCGVARLEIIQRIALRTGGSTCREVRFRPNLFADQAIFVVAADRV